MLMPLLPLEEEVFLAWDEEEPVLAVVVFEEVGAEEGVALAVDVGVLVPFCFRDRFCGEEVDACMPWFCMYWFNTCSSLPSFMCFSNS